MAMSSKSREVKGYRIIKQIGQGTYGTVYKVQRTKTIASDERQSTQKYYALKEIDISKLNKKEMENVHREQETMKSYNHRHIVRYHESFLEGLRLYIVMEYCEGGSLCHYLERRKAGLEEKEFISFLKQIMEGVKFLHSKHVIHRDLKTKNILLTGDHTIKIADFGVARSIDTNESSQFSKFVGTVHYMSPEMICANPKYNEKTDIWSVGCTCYEMGTAKYAFDGKNLPRIKQAVLRRQLHDVDKMQFCESVKDLIFSMLKTKPDDRPSAEEILENLEQHTCPKTSLRSLIGRETLPLPSPVSSDTIPGSPIPFSKERQEPLGMSKSTNVKEIVNGGNESALVGSNRNISSDRGRESPRDRWRRRSSGSTSSVVSRGSSKHERKRFDSILKRYKGQSKRIQNDLAEIFDDYNAHVWVVTIQGWCKECSNSIEDVERKSEELLKCKRNVFKMARRMIRSLKETEDGIKDIEDMKVRTDEQDTNEEEEEEEDTSLASSTFTN